jgi:hypothetical protein
MGRRAYRELASAIVSARAVEAFDRPRWLYRAGRAIPAAEARFRTALLYMIGAMAHEFRLGPARLGASLGEVIISLASGRASWIRRLRPLTRRERNRRRAILQHDLGAREASASGILIPDKPPTSEDVAIAGRLLRAFRAAAENGAPADPERRDLWTIIAIQQEKFTSLLHTGDEEQLASYLCNVSRHDASVGITQGDREYRRILSDPAYRDFVTLMTKDKLVSLAEAVGYLPVENPEQGEYGRSLQVDADELVAGISQRLEVDITPPDIDGGMLKLRTNNGLFHERDANAIFTAWLLRRVLQRHGARRVCEIGAGSGRVAYWSRRLGSGSHTIVDLPHVNVVQGYYLLKSVPGERVRLYGEKGSSGTIEFTIWPNHALQELPNAEFDVVLNQDSMPEMSRSTVDDYLNWIRLTCRGTFMSVNHESKPPYGENLTHVSVPEAVAATGGFVLQDRYPYWLRKGYVVELYSVTQPIVD